MIGRSSGFGDNYSASAELSGTSRGRDCRTPIILPRKQSAVLAGGMFLLNLRSDRRSVPFPGIRFLLCTGTSSYAALAAIESYVRVVVYDHRAVNVDVGNVDRVHMHHGGVIEEMAAAPFAAAKARAKVSEAVINAAVKSDLRAPVAGIPYVQTIVPAPVPGSPQQAWFRSFHPCAGHPVIAIVVAPRPVTGSPQITVVGADWLLVDRQRGRANAYRNADADPDLRGGWRRESCWNHQQQESKGQQTNCTVKAHRVPRA